MPRNHPLVKMTELREEGGSTLESLLTLIASHTISRLDLTAALKGPSQPHLCFYLQVRI